MCVVKFVVLAEDVLVIQRLQFNGPAPRVNGSATELLDHIHISILRYISKNWKAENDRGSTRFF